MPRVRFETTVHDDIDERETVDPWDRPDSWRDTVYHGFYVVGVNDYHDDSVDFEPEVGAHYTLVYVNYDTGDSFGRDHGRHELVGMFNNDDDADRVVKAIRADMARHRERHRRGEETEYSLEVTLSNGKTLTVHSGTWKGYFEQFNDVVEDVIECLGDRR